jgi:hypothetical protein
MRKVQLAVWLVAIMTLVIPPASVLLAQGGQPTVDDVIARASRYVVEYAERMTFVIATEEYGQYMEIPNAVRPMRRMLVSEYALVRIGDDWEGFRDVFNVDSRPVGERRDRLEKLFLESPGGAVRQARQIADESARYNMGNIKRNFNTPTMALLFLQEKNLGRFKFKKNGEDKVAGVAVWKVRFEEVKKPTIIRTAAGKDMPVDGTFWIDPTDGRVLKSHMQMKSETKLGGPNSDVVGVAINQGDPMSSARGTKRDPWDRAVHSSASVTVTYSPDEHLGLLVPAEMLETYEGPWKSSLGSEEGTSKINCRATYSDFKRFETGNKVIIK